MEYIVIPLAFAIGLLTKFTDVLVDENPHLPRSLAFASAAAYGTLIAYTASFYPVTVPLAMAVVLAVVVTRKIDSLPHAAGIAAMAISLFFWGVPEMPGMNFLLLAAFLGAGIADEAGSDMADRGKVRGMPAKALKYRIILEAVVFVSSLLTGIWTLFAGMASFDIAYHVMERAGRTFPGTEES